MLKQRDLFETNELYELIIDPTVYPYVRNKPTSPEEYLFMTKQIIEEEALGKTISRTIIDPWGQPIGTINLFDIFNGVGFLGTWIGVPFQGKGYNRIAKDEFLNELFFQNDFHTVFLKIRKENIKSQRAVQKLPYVIFANDLHKQLYEEINSNITQFDLYKIPKDLFYLTMMQNNDNQEEQAM